MQKKKKSMEAIEDLGKLLSFNPLRNVSDIAGVNTQMI